MSSIFGGRAGVSEREMSTGGKVKKRRRSYLKSGPYNPMDTLSSSGKENLGPGSGSGSPSASKKALSFNELSRSSPATKRRRQNVSSRAQRLLQTARAKGTKKPIFPKLKLSPGKSSSSSATWLQGIKASVSTGLAEQAPPPKPPLRRSPKSSRSGGVTGNYDLKRPRKTYGKKYSGSSGSSTGRGGFLKSSLQRRLVSSASRSVWSRSEMTGFRNLGNSCYMNAVLQALLGMRGFVRDLESVDTDRFARDSFYGALLDIARRKRDKDHRGPIDVHSLKSAIGSRYKRFAGNSQQDAHEFLSECINRIEMDIVEALGLSREIPTTPAVPPAPATPAVRTPVKKQTESHWSCTRCTLHNPPDVSKCKVCQHPREAQPVVEVNAVATPNPTPKATPERCTPKQSTSTPSRPSRGSPAIRTEIDEKALQETSAVSKNFHFQLCGVLKCTNAECGHRRTVTEDFHDLSLDLGDPPATPTARTGGKMDAKAHKSPFFAATDDDNAFEGGWTSCSKCGRSCAQKWSKNKGKFFYKCQTCQSFVAWVEDVRKNKSTATAAGGKSPEKLRPAGSKAEVRCANAQPAGPAEATLSGLLGNFFGPHVIECRCEKCGNDKVTTHWFFHTTPNVLVLHLKRFQPNFKLKTYEKRSDPISVGETIDIAAFLEGNKWACTACTFINESSKHSCDMCEKERPRVAAAKYKLQAAVLHQGFGAASGHYVSDVREEHGWKRYNDSRVKSVSEANSAAKIRKEGYILFYERQPTDPKNS